MCDFTDREIASYILLPLDYESQLEAIKDLLNRHKKAEQLLSAEIDQETKLLSNIENDSTLNSFESFQISMVISDFRNERSLKSVYQSAAHSMAAIGMIAPLVESIFMQVFRLIGLYYDEKRELPRQEHHRWNNDDRWNCHFIWDNNGKKTDDVVRGIMQLADFVGLLPFLTQNLKLKLEALFAYRNKMFHCGFEWPELDRRNFANRIQNDKWPDYWFSSATNGESPWIFYMTDKFILDWLSEIEKIFDAVGAFYRANESIHRFTLFSITYT